MPIRVWVNKMQSEQNQIIIKLEQSLKQLKATNTQLVSQIEAEKQVATTNQHQLEYITSISSVALREPSVGRLIQRFIQRTAEFTHCDWAYYVPLAKHNFQLKNQYRYSNKPDIKLDSLNAKNIKNSVLQNMINQNEAETCILGDDFLHNTEITFELVILFPIVFEKGTYGCVIFCYQGESIEFSDQIIRVQTIETIRTQVADAIKRRLTEQTLHNRVTELHDSNKALEDTQKQLLRSERMASIGQLAAGVAHEINNPIGYVASNLETLTEYLHSFLTVVNQLPELHKNYLTDTQSIKAQLDDIQQLMQAEDFEFIANDSQALLTETQKGLHRVKQIVAGLKTFSHMDEDGFKPFDLEECIQQALAVCWNQLKYKVDIIQHLAENTMISGNKGQIEQVLVNMFINALHAMEEKGGLLTVVSFCDGQNVRVSITDTGSGIPENSLTKMFDPFYTTKPVGVGTGLGLSISLNIIEKHQGSIDVKSKEGFGTCFTISFPNLNQTG